MIAQYFREKTYCSLLGDVVQLAQTSYRIHEVSFYAVKDDDGEEEGDEHEDGAVEEAAPIEGTTAHTAVFKGFEYRGKGVQGDEVLILAGSCAEWVDDWCGVHEELDTKAYQLTEVTVLGGHGRDDHAP